MSTQPGIQNIPAVSEDAFRHQVYEIIIRELGLPGYVRFLRPFLLRSW